MRITVTDLYDQRTIPLEASNPEALEGMLVHLFPDQALEVDPEEGLPALVEHLNLTLQRYSIEIEPFDGLTKAQEPPTLPKLGAVARGQDVDRVSTGRNLEMKARLIAHASQNGQPWLRKFPSYDGQVQRRIDQLEDPLHRGGFFQVAGYMNRPGGGTQGDPSTRVRLGYVKDRPLGWSPDSIEGTFQHERFHAMMAQVESQHGPFKRHQLADNMYAAIPDQYKRHLDRFFRHATGENHVGKPDESEERLARIFNYVNSKSDRDNFHGSSFYDDDERYEVDRAHKRALQALRAVAEIADQRWLHPIAPWERVQKSEALAKNKTTPKFPKLGVPDNRRETRILSTGRQVDLAARSALNYSIRAQRLGVTPTAGASSEEANEQFYQDMKRKWHPTRTMMLNGVREGTKTALGSSEYIGPNINSHALGSNLRNSQSFLRDAVRGTLQHEDLHNVFKHVQEKYGEVGRQNLAKNIFRHLELHHPKEMRTLQQFVNDRYPNVWRTIVPEEEHFSTLLNYLNEPVERKAWHDFKQHPEETRWMYDRDLSTLHHTLMKVGKQVDKTWVLHPDDRSNLEWNKIEAEAKAEKIAAARRQDGQVDVLAHLGLKKSEPLEKAVSSRGWLPAFRHQQTGEIRPCHEGYHDLEVLPTGNDQGWDSGFVDSSGTYYSREDAKRALALNGTNSGALHARQFQEGVKKSEPLEKVTLTPDSTARTMRPHEPSDYESFDRIETYPSGTWTNRHGNTMPLFHHVFYKSRLSAGGYQSVMHVLSDHEDYPFRGSALASSAAGLNTAEDRDEWQRNRTKNLPWQNGQYVQHGETTSTAPGAGLGSILYRNMARVHGRMTSDSSTSEGANGVWQKLVQDPEFRGALSFNPGEVHWVEHQGQKPVPSRVIEGDGRSLKQMRENPNPGYRFDVKSFGQKGPFEYVEVTGYDKDGNRIGGRGLHLDHTAKRIYQQPNFRGGYHHFNFPHGDKGAGAMALHHAMKQTGYYFGGDLPDDRVQKSEQHWNTPEFKQWFGNSHVKHPDGRPMVVYHGTERAGFAAFDADRAGSNTGGNGRKMRGIFFTNHPWGAQTYSGSKREAQIHPDQDNFDPNYDGEPGNYPVYLSMQNPMHVDFEGRGWDGSEPDGGIHPDHIDRIVEEAHANGHDGVIAHNINDEGRHGQGYGWGDTTYVVFHPHQIKHATQNLGTYSAADPDIRKTGLKMHKSEPLEKGAMSRIAPYSPEKDREAAYDSLIGWQLDNNPDLRQRVPQMSPEGLTRALHKLHGASEQVRRGADGKREFLLHRGMGGNEIAYIKNGTYQVPAISGWTPDRRIAEGYVRSAQGRLVSAWVPESAIHSVPKQLGRLRLWDPIKAQPMAGGRNEYAPEYEVLVKPSPLSVHQMEDRQQINARYAQGQFKKSERNLLDGTSYETVEDMHGYQPHLNSAFAAARYLTGARYIPTIDVMRRALYDHDDDMEAAALAVHNIEVTDQNRKALRHVQKYANLNKAEVKPPSLGGTAAPGTQDAADAVKHVNDAISNESIERVKLGGMHSAGSLLAHAGSKIYLLKPGSGGQSPAAGARQDGASQSRREAAFWHVANAWGLGDDIPRADLLLIGGTEYAAIEMLPFDWKNLAKVQLNEPERVIQALGAYREIGTLHRWAIIDFVLGNPDRHGQNLMVSPDGQVKLIDHGSAFAGSHFDPANDKDSFVPYYLRAQVRTDKFNSLPVADKLRHMPTLHPEVEREVRSWLMGLDEKWTASLCQEFGIDPAPVQQRLRRVKEAQGPIDVAINRLWVTV